MRCVAIYWKQLCWPWTCFSCHAPYVKLLECQRKKTKLLSVFLSTSARPNSDKRLGQQHYNVKPRIWPNISWKSTDHPFSTQTCYIVIIDSKLFGADSHNFDKHLLNTNFFLRISILKTFLRCPKLETGFLALPLRPRATVVRGIQRGAFREQELRSLHLALARRQVERHSASAAFPGLSAAVASADDGWRGRGPVGTKVVDSWALYPFNKRTMNVLDWTSSKCSKQNIITNNHKISQHTEQVSLHVVYNIAFNRTFCNSFSKNW